MNYKKLLLTCGVITTAWIQGNASAMGQDHFGNSNSASAALYFKLPFTGTLKTSRTLPYEYGLSLSLRQNYNNFHSPRQRGRYNLRAMDIKFSDLGLESMSVAGQRFNVGAYKLRLDGDENDAGFTKTGLILGGVGLAIIAAIALTGDNEQPDACIAIFPKPPGCP